MELNNKFKPESDKEIWFRDTYAIWSMANFNAFMNFCGTEFNLDNAKDCKLFLSRDWGVETKDDLIDLAHRLCDFNNKSDFLSKKMKERDEQNYYESLDFVAWDLCCGTQVLGMGFVSEIIDRETMIEESSKIAHFMQTFFTSWEDLITHYLNGYREWALETFETDVATQAIQLRMILHYTLKVHPLGCYKIDWNLPIYDTPGFSIMSNNLLEHNDEDNDIETDLDEYSPIYPTESSNIVQDDPTLEDDMIYLTSREHLKKKEIPVMEEFMALSLRKSSVKLRSIEEICQRIVALYTVAIYSECLRDENQYEDENTTKAIIECITNRYNSDYYYSELEEDFMNDEEVLENSIIQFSWSYECVGVLLWALGLYETDNEPDEVCSSEDLTLIIQKFESLEEMIDNAELKSVDELLLEQDIYMRYHWACIEARLNKEEPKGNMILSSIIERHKALNWLLTDIFGDDWDNIQCLA